MRIIEQVSDLEPGSLSPDTPLFDGLLDSFAVVELLVAIESDLGVRIALTEVDPDVWSTPRAIADHVARKRG